MSLKKTAEEIARSVEEWPEWKKETFIARPPRRTSEAQRRMRKSGTTDKRRRGSSDA